MSIKTYTAEHGMVKYLHVVSNPTKNKALFAKVEITNDLAGYLSYVVDVNKITVVETTNLALAMETYDNL